MMRHLDRSRCALCAGLALAMLLSFGSALFAAPAPFHRPTLRPKQLHREDLVGTWTMVWSGHQWTITLTSTGDYTCQGTGLTFIGSWGLDHQGRFWITESSRPSDAQSWRSYAVRLDPTRLSGRIEVGSPGTEVRLLRIRPGEK